MSNASACGCSSLTVTRPTILEPRPGQEQLRLRPGGVREVRTKRSLLKRGVSSWRKDGTALALDPDRPSKPLWSRKIGRGSIQGCVLWGMTGDPGRVYVPISDMADSGDGKVYTEPAKGGLYALYALTGELLWSNPADDICKGERACDPGIAAAITSIPGAVLAGHMDGRIRIYDDATGKVLWEYNSRQEVVTLSGERARGGSVSGPGPVVHGGIVYVNSGYGLYFHLPG